MLRRSFLPKGEIITVFLLRLTIQFTRLRDDVIEVTTGEFTIRIVFRIFLYVHINGAIGDISVTFIENLLHKGDLFDDMARSMRLNRRRQHVQRRHITMVAVCIILHHLHRLELLETGFLSNLIFAFIRIVLKVTHIGDVAHVPHFITQLHQVAIQHIKGNRRTGVPQMGIAVHRRSADIHAHMPFVQRLEGFFESC